MRFDLLVILVGFALAWCGPINGQNRVHEVDYLPEVLTWELPTENSDYRFDYSFEKSRFTGIFKIRTSNGVPQWLGLELGQNGTSNLPVQSCSFDKVSKIGDNEWYAVNGNDVIRLKMYNDLVILKQLEHYDPQTKSSTVLNFHLISEWPQSEITLPQKELVIKEKEKLKGAFGANQDTVKSKVATVDPVPQDAPGTNQLDKAVTAPRTEAVYHKVVPGENMYRIGLKYGVKPAQIMELNGLEGPGLFVGQRLLIEAATLQQTVTPTTNVAVKDMNPSIPSEKTVNATVESVRADSSLKINQPKSVEEKVTPQLSTSAIPAQPESIQKKKDVIRPQPVALNQGISLCESGIGVKIGPSLMALTDDVLKKEMDVNIRDSIALKEFFHFDIQALGSVTHLEDQRTATNKNTNYLTDQQLNQLADLTFTMERDRGGQCRAPIGFSLEATRIKYNVKITAESIRLYNIPLYFEYIKPEHPHYQLIMAELAGSQKPFGRYQVEVVEGKEQLSLYAKKEYNPFGVLLKELHTRPFSYIESFTPME